MLAWIHQTLASEKELLQALLKYCYEECKQVNFVYIHTISHDAMYIAVDIYKVRQVPDWICHLIKIY